MTYISKEDTWDIADIISTRLDGIRVLDIVVGRKGLLHEIIEEELNEWITVGEIEDADDKSNDIV